MCAHPNALLVPKSIIIVVLVLIAGESMKNNFATSQHVEILAQQTTTRLSEKFPSINFTSTSRALMSLSKRGRLDDPI